MYKVKVLAVVLVIGLMWPGNSYAEPVEGKEGGKGEVLFSDDFSGPELSKEWETIPGRGGAELVKWSVEDGKLVFDSTDHACIALFPKDWTDYEINVRGRYEFGKGFFVAFRVNEPSIETYQNYSFGFHTSARGPVHLQTGPGKIVKGISKCNSNVWYKIRVVVKGNHIQCYLNDKLEIDYVDEENFFPQGGVALQGFRGNEPDIRCRVIFDDFSVVAVK